MERATVIVALPPVDDRINKRSSEEVPHLTLLYLGDVELSAEAVLYVQHAAKELSPFGLSVDYRGTLGEDEADVIFFEKTAWDMDRISSFRHHLLLNDEIKAAYDAAPQHNEHPDWTPHLTLGYPATPAPEPEDEDARRIYYVDFDRIAVWTGDFEGPEFRLKYSHSGMDEVMAMSDISTTERGSNAVAELFHYGKKGMRWGVRNNLKPGSGEGNSGGHDPSLSARQRKKDDKWRYKVNLDAPGLTKSVKYADKASFDAINKKPEYKDLDFTKPSPLHTKYQNEINDVWAKAMTSYVAKKHGVTNPSKTKKMEWSWNAEHQSYSSKMVSVGVKHAEDVDVEPETVLINDEDGYVTGFIIGIRESEDKEAAMSSMSERGASAADQVLKHYGKKGMRWGVTTVDKASKPTLTREKDMRVMNTKDVTVTQRKPGKYVKTKGGQRQKATDDAVKAAAARQKAKKSTTDALTNDELKAAVERMNLEKNYAKLDSQVQRRGQGFISRLFQSSEARSATADLLKRVAETNAA